MPSLTTVPDSPVWVLDLGADENRFNPTWLAEVTACLDEVEAAPGPRALVTVASGPKIWSNGLDLEWLMANPGSGDSFVTSVHQLLARFLVSPAPSIAALTGHTFAAGAMLALAHDARVMRADRGFLCLPEIDIRIPFTPGMAALIQARVSPGVAHEAMTTGRRYGGTDALYADLVDEVAGVDAVLPAAIARAEALAGKDGPTLAAIKKVMYAPALAALSAPAALTAPA